MSSQTIDMQGIRYLNLFEKITGVRTKSCFPYNNYIVFAVPSSQMSRAIGEQGSNVKKIVSILGRRIKIVSLPRENREIRRFVSEIVSPITFKDLQIEDSEIVISGNRQSKASLIGRNKVRLLELEKIIKEFLGKSLRII